MNDMYFLDFRTHFHTKDSDKIEYERIDEIHWHRYCRAFPILRDNEFIQKFHVDVFDEAKFAEIIDFLYDEEKETRIASAVLTEARYAQFLLMFG